MPRTPNSPNSAGSPNRLSGQRLTILEWHIPQFLKRLMPQAVVCRLRDLKGRILTRSFPHSVTVQQLPEDILASRAMSIIVPVHDAPMVTRRCLASLEKYAPESEIILVDDASSQSETLELIQDFSHKNGWSVV